MRYVIRTPDGTINVETDHAVYDGDSPLVDELHLLTSELFVDRLEGQPGVDSWAGPGATLLALELVEPRFAREWRSLLPYGIANAEKPTLDPTDGTDEGTIYA